MKTSTAKLIANVHVVRQQMIQQVNGWSRGNTNSRLALARYLVLRSHEDKRNYYAENIRYEYPNVPTPADVFLAILSRSTP